MNEEKSSVKAAKEHQKTAQENLRKEVEEAINHEKKVNPSTEKNTAKESSHSRNQDENHNRDQKDIRVAELTLSLQRLQAEFENYKKRLEKEQSQFAKSANEQLIIELLPILDNFQLAFKQIRSKELSERSEKTSDGVANTVHENFTKGIELIYSQLYDLLEKQGLQKVETKGIFDPQIHEALLQEQSDKQEGTILEELQAGYKIHEKIIRPAKVKIAKKDS